MAVYLVLFVSMDWLTRAFQIFPGVVAWYPPSGISFAFLLIFGVGFLPWVAISSLISSFLIYQIPSEPGGLLGWAILIAGIYTISSAILRRRIRIDPQLGGTRDILWLIVSSVVVSAILAIISVSLQTSSGTIAAMDWGSAVFQWWIGETIGILVLTPVMLIHIMPSIERFTRAEKELAGTRKPIPPLTLNIIGQALSIMAALYLVFGLPALEPFQDRKSVV